MAHETNQRHVAVGVETTHESVRMTEKNGAIDLHVNDPLKLNDVLKSIREMSPGHTQPNVYPHERSNAVAIRLTNLK